VVRYDLKVPFAEKDAAKKLGARWDAARKTWYVIGRDDLAAFAKWSPRPQGEASPAPAFQARATAKAPAGGKVHVGSAYVERPQVCQCLPWETCDKCREFAL